MNEQIERAPGRVLSSMNEDGSRRWIRPRLSRGRFLTARRVVAWFLVALFALIPHLRLNGKPLMLFDIPKRQFTLFGTTFLPTDTLFLTLLLLAIFVGIFLLTAIFGRVWCGWACPQTVYMEFVYRPIERLFEGSRAQQLKRDREGPDARRLLKWLAFAVVSLLLAHTFLAYFVEVPVLLQWMRGSPLAHPASFLLVFGTTLLMLFDFGYFREQVCVVACPYGRFQSVLLDRRSLVVGYDARRGEPRGKPAEREAGRAGDCIDCQACVVTCPTGIDIRDGLQMECVGCTQCIDACDAIMDRLGRPRGLIRYSSQDALAGRRSKVLRPRVILYPLVLVLLLGLLGASLARRESADVTLLRGIGSPFAVLPDGSISNQLRVKVVNRGAADASYLVELLGAPEFHVVAPQNPLPVAAGRSETATLFVVGPASAFTRGERTVRVRVAGGAEFAHEQEYRLLGPEGR
ncbi:MAG: cytochrome c oxidase accessory protein CcoG [Acidobacteria bacterium]|nr:cytochrome c oxidase accessory protein CcoG [Acidobacteriota bacterium]